MKRSLAILVALLCFHGSAAAQGGSPEITARLDRDEAVPGDRVRVILEVVGEQGADCFLSRIPEIHGARVEKVEGPDFSLKPREGDDPGETATVLVTRFEVTLIPIRAGTLSIPPLEISVQRGRKFLGPPLTLEVRAGPPPKQGIALVVEPVRTPIYRFERLRIRVVLTLDDQAFSVLQGEREGAALSLPWLEREPSFLAVATLKPNLYRARWAVPILETESTLPCSLKVLLDQKPTLHRLEGEINFLPAKTGFFTLPESSFSYALPGSTPMVLISPALEVEVRPLPAAGRPASFTNGVGRFTVRFEAQPLDVKVGESIHLIFDVMGKGNLDYLDLPAFSALEKDFHLFGTEARNGRNMRGRIYHIAPRSEQVKEIPELAFSYFDPEEGAYRTERWGPLPITVRPGGAVGGGSGPGGGEEIDTIKEEPKAAVGETLPGPITLAVLVLSTVFLVWSAVAARSRRAVTEASERARKAYAVFRAAGGAVDPDGLAASFRRFLAHRFRLSPSEAMAGSCGDRLLERGVAPELAHETEELLKLLDARRFAPDGERRSIRDLAERAKKLAHRLEREKGNGKGDHRKEAHPEEEP